MSITKKFNGLNLFAVSVGHKMLRGGRLTKRAGQVVSYSPHVAELLGSASRAAIGGALVLGSAMIAPAAMADVDPVCVGTDDVVCSGSTTNEQSVTLSADGTLTLDETLNIAAHATAAIGVTASGAIEVTGEDGSFLGNTNGDGLAMTSQGQTDIVLATDFDVSGTAVVASNFAAGDSEQNVTVLGSIVAGSNGVVASHSGTGPINLTVGEDAEIDAGGTAVYGIASGNGHVSVTNHGSLSGATGVFAGTSGDGDISVTNNGSVDAQTFGLVAQQNLASSGDIDVTSNGWITLLSDDAVGILAVTAEGGDSDVTILNASLIGDFSLDTQNTTGIEVDHESDGNVEVTNDGIIAVSANGIDITSQNQGDVSVTLGTQSGIVSIFEIDGDPDRLGGANGVAVALAETSVGDVKITSNGMVYGFENALNLSHAGAGDINVEVARPSGEVGLFSLASGGAAIDAVHSGAGDVDITLGENAVVVAGVTTGLFEGDEVTRPTANGIEIRRGTDAVGLTLLALKDGAFVDATDDAVFLVNQGAVDTEVTLEEGTALFAGSDGIYFRNYGTGSLKVDVAGDIVTGEAGDEPELDDGEEPSERPIFRYGDGSGIYAVGAHQGDLDVTVSGGIDVGGTGIALYHTNMGNEGPSVGDIRVNIDGGSILAGYNGVEAIHYGNGDIDIDNSGEIAAGIFGIDAAHNGTGNITIDNLADGEISSDHFGISAQHNGTGNLTVTNAGAIEKLAPQPMMLLADWTDTGILAERTTRGNVNVVNGLTGNITGYDFGIHAIHSNSDEPTFGSLTVFNAGTIEANYAGILAWHHGSNDIDITNTGSITANDMAMEARHYNDGDIRLTNGSATNKTATLTAYEGIYAAHYGYGDIIATNYGIINGAFDTENYNGAGIGGRHRGEGNFVLTNAAGGSVNGDWSMWAEHYGIGDITISNAGSVTSTEAGLYAYHGADEDEVRGQTVGNILITNSGSITSDWDGIYAEHQGLGTVTIHNLAGAVINAESDDGIEVERDRSGTTLVTNAGSIIADDYGVEVSHDDGGDITVINAAGGYIYSEDEDAIEINVEHGRSNVLVVNAGTLEADDEDGIEVHHYGTGDIRVDSTGVIRAWDHGINVQSYNEGTIEILAHNAASMGESRRAGVNAEQFGIGDITIVTTGLVEGNRAGVSAWTFDGDISITNQVGGHIRNISGLSTDLAITSGASYALGSWNPDLEEYEEYGSASTVLVNNGTITGTVDFSFTDETQTVTFTNNGTWNNAGGTNYMGYGDDTLTIGDGGVWNATGSTTYFDGAAPVLQLARVMDFAPFNVAAGDVMTIEEGATVIAGETSFIGLETLVVDGALNTANGTSGQVFYTDGDVAFGETSKLIVETGGTDVSDALTAGGDITIAGGTVQVTNVGSTLAAIGDVYTIVESIGGEVTGEFDTTVINNTAFLGWEVGYTDTTVNLTYAQLNALDDAAETPNQLGVAGGLDSLAITNPLLVATLNLSDFAAARAAFNGLSGEIHPGARTAMMQDSRLPRNAVLERLQTPQDAAIWGQGFWNTGKTDGAKSGNTAKIDRETWGVILGADLPLGESAVLGVAGSYLSNDMNQIERNSTAKADTIHALGYVGATSGAANFKAGLGYAWGDVETARSVAVGTISNKLTADYDAKLFQAFAEAGIRVGLAGGYVEPMANVTYLKAKSDAFTETGGEAALTSASASQDNTLLTVGSRFSTSTSGAFAVRGMLGWHHVFGALVPTNSFNFNGGDSFTIAGVAQSRDAAVVNIEANFDLSSGAALGVGYDGVVGNDAQDHAAKVSLRIKF